jgi:uncharacterized protein
MNAIDRIAPTRRPNQVALMRQAWRHLLFLHWAVPAEHLAALLPPGLTLDTHEGRAYVGLVPFTVLARPPGLPASLSPSRFHEVNVRTYVHVNGQDPGVWFFSLDAASLPAVLGARAGYRLAYYFAEMKLRTLVENDGHITVDYRSRRLWPGPKGAGCSLQYGSKGAGPREAVPGTLEHFLVERYILYSYSRGTLRRARVHHAPYPLQDGWAQALDESLLAASRIHRPNETPLCHYAREVDVEIFKPERVR